MADALKRFSSKRPGRDIDCQRFESELVAIQDECAAAMLRVVKSATIRDMRVAMAEGAGHLRTWAELLDRWVAATAQAEKDEQELKQGA